VTFAEHRRSLGVRVELAIGEGLARGIEVLSRGIGLELIELLLGKIELLGTSLDQIFCGHGPLHQR
jgi:hypothetical protein